jgi:hypothetical protein
VKRHRFDPFSLLFGAIFVSVGVSFLAGSTIAEASDSVWPMTAVVLGATLAAWAVATVLRERRPRPDAIDDSSTFDEQLVPEEAPPVETTPR